MEVEEVKRLVAERAGELKEAKAQAIQAQRDALAEQGWYKFLVWHAGARGAQNGAYLSCEANQRILEEHISSQDNKQIDFTSLEKAYQACKDRLAMPSVGEYERKTNTQRSKIPQQQVSFPPQKIVLNYSVEEIKKMPAGQMHKLMNRGPEYLEALNRILSEGRK
jgi:hypothetical protein